MENDIKFEKSVVLSPPLFLLSILFLKPTVSTYKKKNTRNVLTLLAIGAIFVVDSKQVL